MTEKLKPDVLPLARYGAERLLGLNDAAAHLEAEAVQELITAWNTRATGWRPIEEWRPAPEQHLFQCEIEGPGFYYEVGNVRPATAVKFMLITPPDSEAPHD